MSVLLEALKKAAEQRAAVDAKAGASQEQGAYATIDQQPQSGSSDSRQEIKTDALSLHSAQQTEDVDTTNEIEAVLSPSGIPLKIKLPITDAVDDEAGDDNKGDLSSEEIEDDKNTSSLEDTKSLQKPESTTEALQVDPILSDTIHRSTESEKEAANLIRPNSSESVSVTGSASYDTPIKDENLKLTEEPVLLSGSGDDDWEVDTDNISASPEEIDFVPAQLTEDKVAPAAFVMPEKTTTTSASQEDIGSDSGYQLQDPSVLIRSGKARRRVSPSVLLLAMLIVTASITGILGFYQNTQPVLSNRYAHIADRHEYELTTLSETGKTKEVLDRQAASHEIRTPTVQEQLKEPVLTPIAEKKWAKNEGKWKEKPVVDNKISEPLPDKKIMHATKTNIVKKNKSNKKAQSSKKGQSNVARMRPLRQDKHLTLHPDLKEVVPNQKEKVSVEQCFEQLIAEGTQRGFCNHINNTSIRLTFVAYRLFRSGELDRARQLINQAYSASPYNVYIVQIYALIAADKIPLKQLESLHEIFPGVVIVALQVANRYTMSGDTNKALAVLMQALDEHPRNGYLLYNAALLANEMNNKALASDLLRRIPPHQLHADSRLRQETQNLEAIVSND